MYLTPPSNPPDRPQSETLTKGRRSRIWTLISQEQPTPSTTSKSEATSENSIDKSVDESNSTNSVNMIHNLESSENGSFEPESIISEDEKPNNVEYSSVLNERESAVRFKEPKRKASSLQPKRRLLFSARIQRFSQSIKTFATRSLDLPPIDWHNKLPLVIGGAKKMQRLSDKRVKVFLERVS